MVTYRFWWVWADRACVEIAEMGSFYGQISDAPHNIWYESSPPLSHQRRPIVIIGILILRPIWDVQLGCAELVKALALGQLWNSHSWESTHRLAECYCQSQQEHCDSCSTSDHSSWFSNSSRHPGSLSWAVWWCLVLSLVLSRLVGLLLKQSLLWSLVDWPTCSSCLASLVVLLGPSW